jgi:RHS repeat-associated protein
MDGATHLKAEYTWIPGVHDKLLYVRTANWTAGVIIDPVNQTVRGLANLPNGQPLKSYPASYWGEVSPDTGFVVRFRHAGREYDAEAGIYYNRSRYYDPQLGRYLSEDPMGIDGGLNLYGYGRNAPVNVRDPFGLAVTNDCLVSPDPFACGNNEYGVDGFPYCPNGFASVGNDPCRDDRATGGAPSEESPTDAVNDVQTPEQNLSCPSSMIWPVDQPRRVSSGWGFRPNPFGFEGVMEGHWAIDIAAPVGADVRASTPGKVLRAGPSQGYGNVVVIRDPTGFTTQYGHITLSVQSGVSVKQGAVIGHVALIGRSTGAHLDFILRYPNGVSKDARKCLP